MAVMQYYQQKQVEGVGIEDIYLGNGVSELIVMQDLNHGTEGVKWRFDFALLEGNWSGPQNPAGNATTNYLNAGAAHFNPQFEARLHAQGKDWLAYLTAHYSEIDLHGVGDIAPKPPRDKLNSIGYDLGGQWKPGPWTFKGLIYTGKALGEIFGAMSQFGLSRMEMGLGLRAGLAIVAVALLLDRLSRGALQRHSPQCQRRGNVPASGTVGEWPGACRHCPRTGAGR